MIDFSEVNYCPIIRTRPAELAGLKHVNDDTKEKLLPVFVIGKWPRTDDVMASYENAINALGERPHVVDLTRIPAHQHNKIHELLDPSENFLNWRRFIESLKKEIEVIPTVQFGNEVGITRLRTITQQAIELEAAHEQIALNIDTASALDRESAMHVLAALRHPTNCLCILQAGYLTRDNMEAAADTTISMMNNIRAVDPSIECVCAGSSFPRSPAEFGSNYGEIPILERDLYRIVGGRNYAIYGDHASIHPVVYDMQMARGFVPRVDYPTDNTWIYYRTNKGASKQHGYIECAKNIMKHENWEDLGIWGTETIKRVAYGNADKMGHPQKWIAVRVNIHLFRQANLSTTMDTEEDIDEWDIDDLI